MNPDYPLRPHLICFHCEQVFIGIPDDGLPDPQGLIHDACAEAVCNGCFNLWHFTSDEEFCNIPTH